MTTYPDSFDPNDEGVIDQFTSAIYEMETFNTFAHEYARRKVREALFAHVEKVPNGWIRYDHAQFADEWFDEWIATEEYGNLNDLPDSVEERYDMMHSLYWDFRAEWFAIMIGNINQANIREQTRITRNSTLHRWSGFHPKSGSNAPWI